MIYRLKVGTQKNEILEGYLIEFSINTNIYIEKIDFFPFRIFA